MPIRVGTLDNSGPRLGADLDGWEHLHLFYVSWLELILLDLADARRAFQYVGPHTAKVRAPLFNELIGSYLIPESLHASWSTVPSSVVARYVVGMNRYLF